MPKGYWQVMLDEDSVAKTAFVVQGRGVFEFLRLPFGMKNSAAVFNRLMRKVFEGLEDVERFVDDVVLHSKGWSEHLDLWEEVFKRCRHAGLTARPSKVYIYILIGFSEMEYVGHVVGINVLKPREEKVNEILEIEQPKTKKQVRAFVALVGYYSKFVDRFADIAKPLTDLTAKKCPQVVNWVQKEEDAFNVWKARLAKWPVLRIVDPNATMYVQTDASDVRLGGALLQEYEGLLHPIRFLSKKLRGARRTTQLLRKSVWLLCGQ